MSLLKKVTGDLIFWFLLICAIIFGVSQFVRMLSSTQGVSTSAYLFTWISVSLNAYLALKAHKAQKSTMTFQVVGIQVLGVAIYAAFIGVVVIKGNNVWDNKDYLTTLLVIFGLTGTLLIAGRQHLSWRDPLVRGYLSLFFKAVPQFVMAYKVYTIGGAGLSGVMMVTFHILTLTRIIQVAITVREAGWDRNRRGLLISESGNEISWLFVTAAWLSN